MTTAKASTQPVQESSTPSYVRIIFDPQEDAKESERDQCYHIFSIITSLYKYKSDRIRDWVNFPKNNGYEALHCTLMSRSGIWVEVQIRSRRMHEVAEKGIAAHWSYKKDGFIDKSQSEVDKWIVQVKEILVNPDVNALDLLDMIHNDLIKSEIFVFTPKGEQRSIEKGSTALDFAYSIHSHIGHKAIAAKVNLKLVPLSRELKTGDQVEIITAETEKPKREWLDFVKTRKAKAHILDYLKDAHKEKRHQFRDTSRIRLNFRGLDRIGMLHDITRYLSMITDVHIKTVHIGTEDGVCEGYIEVKANKHDDIETIINEMRKVEGIQEISRAEI